MISFCMLDTKTNLFKISNFEDYLNLVCLKSVSVVLKQSKDAEVMLKMGSTQDKREQLRLMRDAMEKRFTRVTRGSLIGGMRLGMFTASYFSLQNFLAETRGVHDVFNFVGAGSATAALFGLIST